MTKTGTGRSFATVLRLRAWKAALVGPSVFWYFPIFYVVLSSQSQVNPIGLTVLLLALMVYVGWGFLVNDLFDRRLDALAGRADDTHGHGLATPSLQLLIVVLAGGSWALAALAGASYATIAVLAVAFVVGFFYSGPPARFKAKAFWGFLANSVIERPLPILVLLVFMAFYSPLILLFPVMMELAWSVFKHQAADLKEDSEAGVTTFAVHLGEKVTNEIVRYFLNPVSVAIILSLYVLAMFAVPALYLPLVLGFFMTFVGVIAAFVAERTGVVTTYLTPTDPPYVMVLNVSYRFMLLPILAYGILVLRPAYFPVVGLLAIALVYQAYAYAKLLSSRAALGGAIGKS